MARSAPVRSTGRSLGNSPSAGRCARSRVCCPWSPCSSRPATHGSPCRPSTCPRRSSCPEPTRSRWPPWPKRCASSPRGRGRRSQRSDGPRVLGSTRAGMPMSPPAPLRRPSRHRHTIAQRAWRASNRSTSARCADRPSRGGPSRSRWQAATTSCSSGRPVSARRSSPGPYRPSSRRSMTARHSRRPSWLASRACLPRARDCGGSDRSAPRITACRTLPWSAADLPWRPAR